MALTFIGTGCGQGVLYCPPSPQETTHWNNGGLPIGEQRATMRAWAKICPLPFFNCHFFTLKEVLSLRRSLSECSLISNQNKTKQNKKHFLSFLHRQNYLHTAACYIFSLRRTDPCHPCKTFRWKDFLISSRLSMGSWTNSCVPLFFSWNCRPRKREAPFEWR